MTPASSSAPDPAPRRALLRPAANPEPGLDYLVTLDGLLPGGGAVAVRYVPDRSILTADALAEYLKAASTGATDAVPEALTGMILGDLGNELLPRWLRVSLTPAPRSGLRHVIVMEERQPHWDNPALLARLAPL